MTGQLLAGGRAGDRDAFAGLVAPYRRELLVHRYPIPGSVADAEDVLRRSGSGPSVRPSRAGSL